MRDRRRRIPASTSSVMNENMPCWANVFFPSPSHFLFHELQVRRWGILWRPMEVGLRKFENVVNAVFRLHNFCRDRKIKVPEEDVGSVVRPTGVMFDEEGYISNDYFDTAPARAGRPAKDQAKVSRPRETIRKHLEVGGFVRPPVDNRNSNRTR